MATPQGNHTISANYIDLAGNVVPGPVGSHGMTVDTTAPEIVSILTTYEAVAHGPKTYSFEFSEAVAGFDASDLHLTSATLSSFTKIDDTHYSVTITPAGYGKGTMNMSVDDNSYTDLAGNGGRGEAGTPMPYSIAPPDVIDLKPGKIIDPREINGKYLYYWDKNGNGLYDDLVTYSEVQFLQASHPELVTPHVGFSSPRSDEEKRLITWLEAAKSEKGVDLFAWGAEEWYTTPDATPPGWTHPIDYPGLSYAFYSNYVVAPGFGDNPAMYHQNALAHAVFEVTF